MKLAGFTYVRNGFDYGVPFLESIQSVLPICEELIVAVGDSTDGTREAIVQLNSPKIKIIDTVWDMQLREGGKVFAQQANIALDHVKADWCLHIQSDEVLHEKELAYIQSQIDVNDADKNVEGFILPFVHFWGGYDHIRNTRRVHNFEIRIFRNHLGVRAYRDSQGFRKYQSFEAYENGTEKGNNARKKIRCHCISLYWY
jgi:glycosyltransferase involved in cell wall biosynthesis